jgi:quercetin dioxygenase-like cupin family protein
VLTKAAELPAHVHHREDEACFVVDGATTVRVGDEPLHAARGGFVFCPRDVPHRLTVDSADLVTPGGLERFWQEIGDPAPTDAHAS